MCVLTCLQVFLFIFILSYVQHVYLQSFVFWVCREDTWHHYLHSINVRFQNTSTKRKRKIRQKAEKPQEEPHVYSFRKRKETNYMKLEVPDDDEFICRYLVNHPRIASFSSRI